jgi:hypothetical protein
MGVRDAKFVERTLKTGDVAQIVIDAVNRPIALSRNRFQVALQGQNTT